MQLQAQWKSSTEAWVVTVVLAREQIFKEL
jgi:hypothetical protein